MEETTRASAGADAPEHDEDLYDIEDFEDEAEEEEEEPEEESKDQQHEGSDKDFPMGNDASDDRGAAHENECAKNERDDDAEAVIGQHQNTGGVVRADSLKLGALAPEVAADDEQHVSSSNGGAGMQQAAPTSNDDADGKMPWLANTRQPNSQEMLNVASPVEKEDDSYSDEAFEHSLAQSSDANADKHAPEQFNAPVGSAPMNDAEPVAVQVLTDERPEEKGELLKVALPSNGVALEQPQTAQMGRDAPKSAPDSPATAEEAKPTEAPQAFEHQPREPNLQRQQQPPQLQRQSSSKTNSKSATMKPTTTTTTTTTITPAAPKPRQSIQPPSNSKEPAHEPQHKQSNQRPESRQSAQPLTSALTKVREHTNKSCAPASAEPPVIRPKTDDRLLQKRNAASTASGKAPRPHTLDGSSRQMSTREHFPAGSRSVASTGSVSDGAFSEWCQRKAREQRERKEKQAALDEQVRQQMLELQQEKRKKFASRRSTVKRNRGQGLHHPKLDYVLAEIAFSPYRVRPGDPYRQTQMKFLQKVRRMHYSGAAGDGELSTSKSVAFIPSVASSAIQGNSSPQAVSEEGSMSHAAPTTLLPKVLVKKCREDVNEVLQYRPNFDQPFAKRVSMPLRVEMEVPTSRPKSSGAVTRMQALDWGDEGDDPTQPDRFTAIKMQNSDEEFLPEHVPIMSFDLSDSRAPESAAKSAIVNITPRSERADGARKDEPREREEREEEEDNYSDDNFDQPEPPFATGPENGVIV